MRIFMLLLLLTFFLTIVKKKAFLTKLRLSHTELTYIKYH